jgi:hypothetical protein
VVLLGVTDVLDDVCHIFRVKVKGAGIWSGYRRAVIVVLGRGETGALSRVVGVGKRKGSSQFIFKLVYRSINNISM